MSINHKILTRKTDAMRQILTLVSRGNTRYTSGIVSTKFPCTETLISNFSLHYHTERTHMQRIRAKAKGEANAHLVLWLESAEQIRWWLLVTTEGDGVIVELENLEDVTDKNSRIALTGYELVKTPRKSGAFESKGPRWTWRMTKETYGAWLERLKSAVRHFSDDGLRQALYSIRSVPGFSESRKQAFALARQAQGEWKRSKSSDWPYGDIFVGFFGRFKKAETIDLVTIRKRVQKEKKKVASSF